jgi:hypothetical protein
MKTKFIFTALCLLTMSFLSAQLKVRSDAKVIVGTEVSEYVQDLNHLLKMQIFGPGSYGSGAKIAFGDFDTFEGGGANAMIGEWGTGDTDRLWLQGKQGIYITRTYGNSIIASYDVSNGDMFTFNCDVWSSGIKLTSDERLKTNISSIDKSLFMLKQLNGVRYNLLSKADVLSPKKVSKINSPNDTISMTDKGRKDKVFLDNFEEQIRNKKPKRIGFLAQDLQKIFPELVEKDSTGYYSVDYIGLIPVIVEAMKDQQVQLDTQAKQIADLTDLVNKSNSGPKKVGASKETDVLTYPILDQNIPNPFNTTTTIGYFLPTTITNASIYVYDMNGVQLKSYSINQRGKGNITIQGSELIAGMYLYALIADGKVIDTKRMILTK